MNGINLVAAEEPERVAVVCGATRWTFADLEAAINRMSHRLVAAGVGPGDRVALWCHNRPEYYSAWNGVARLGAIAVPVPYRATAPEARYIIEDSGAKVLVHDVRERAADATRDAASVTVVDIDDPALRSLPEVPPVGDYLGAMPVAMSYTSGTTGRPKGIVRRPPEPATEAAPNPASGFFGYDGDGVHLVVGPLYHTAPGAHGLMNLWQGGRVVILERFDADAALDAIEAERVVTSFMTPAHFIRILEADWSRRDRSGVRRIWHAGAPCPPAVKRRILEVFPDAVWEFYGMSEGMGGVISPDEWLERPGSVGRAFPGLEYRILDDEGNELPTGEVGLVYVSSVGGYEFAYHGAEDKTRAAWRDGFYTVGDLGRLDTDGYLFLADRSTDLILRGGVNVYPAEVERALAEHPDVVDAAVFGLPDERLGQKVHAVVELRPGAATGTAELLDHLATLLAPEKRPAAIELVDELPREPNGKVLKRVLQADRR